jgi:ribonuclease P protein component
VQRAGHGVGSRSFVLVVHRREDTDGARLGLVASRKVGNAVQRNRAKRLVREWFRHGWRQLPNDLDLVVILRRGAHERSAAELCDELDKALRRSEKPRHRGRKGPRPSSPGKSSA